MSELYFLRHGQRIDDALAKNAEAKALLDEYQAYDPSLSTEAVGQMEKVAQDIMDVTKTFDKDAKGARKNVFIHFSPYLRCCQSADLLMSKLREQIQKTYPNYRTRFQLLGDLALSEWIHENMTHKPPITASNEAYNMYTPNLKVLTNRSACSNFRPINTLGPFNGPDLSYKDYQARCKDYFKKLLATYDTPAYIRNQDIVIVISHGYLVNNFLSYFINHPIFDEIPEAGLNFAKRHIKEDLPEGADEFNAENFYWKLEKDALGLVDHENVDSTLNLETDIVYYKTTFIKKANNTDDKTHLVPLKERPRPSFKVQVDRDSAPNAPPVRKYNTYICPAAENWTPQQSNQFKIKSDFQIKVMNDDSFKKSFSLTNKPLKPVSPEVSPNSEPSRSNSVIDLSKLTDNHEIQPMKLRYSSTSEIPVHQLNSKINSQVNLLQYQRSGYNSSNDSSSVDLPRFLGTLATRKRSLSNPVNVTYTSKDSYFPSVVNRSKSPPAERTNYESFPNRDSASPVQSDDLDIIEENRSEPLQSNFPGSKLGRTTSLKHKRTTMNGRSLLGKYQETQKQKQQNNVDESDDETDDMPGRLFSLSFNTSPNSQRTETSKPHNPRSRIDKRKPSKESIKFIPSVINDEDGQNADRSSTPVGFEVSKMKNENNKKSGSMFYHFMSDNSSNSSSDASDTQSDMDVDQADDKPYLYFKKNET